MEEHLEAVASRALIVARPPKNRDLKDILASYASERTRPGIRQSANGDASAASAELRRRCRCG